MAYVNLTFKEGTLISDLGAMLAENGWTYKTKFRKVVYANNLTNAQNIPDVENTVSSAVAEHTIYENADGLLYGIAKVVNFTDKYGQYTPTKPYTNAANEAALATWLNGKYSDFSKDCSIFFYMLEKLPDVVEGAVINHAVPSTAIERGAVDIETTKSAWVTTGQTSAFTYTEFDEDVQQSPFVKSTLRNPNLVGTNVATNWWPDSLVRVTGFIDASTMFVIVQADSTPAFQNNVVPSVPWYLGKFESFKEGDTGNHALFAGTAFDTGTEANSHSFDFKSSTPYRTTANYLPLQKTYPNFPGNGVDNVIVKRSELGSRYQAYYLSWNTAPQAMPPDRVGKNGGQYPLAWNTQENDEYKYKFNPSVYSQKIHTSRAYLIHPDEGVRGYLPKMVMLAPLGLVNNDKLRVRTGTCPDTFDVYRFFLTSAISPVSKRPGTAFTPAGIGIYEKSI